MSMDATIFEPSQKQVELYVGLVDDHWKRNHEEAQKCLDFEETLAFGLFIYQRFVFLFDTWHRGVIDNQIQFDPKVRQACESLFKWWLLPCDKVESEIQSWKKQGYEIKDAEKFRKCRAEAEWFLMSDEKLLAHPTFEDLAKKAEEDYRKGKTTPLES